MVDIIGVSPSKPPEPTRKPIKPDTPAFARPASIHQDSQGLVYLHVPSAGLTKREWFIGMALTGLLARQHPSAEKAAIDSANHLCNLLSQEKSDDETQPG